MGSKSEEIKREQEIAEQARPVILDHVLRKRDALETSREVAERWDIDERLSYRWVQYISEEFMTAKRRFVTIGLVLLWAGALVAATGVMFTVFSILPTVSPWIIGLAVGVPLIAAGVIVVARAGRMARSAV